MTLFWRMLLAFVALAGAMLLLSVLVLLPVDGVLRDAIATADLDDDVRSAIGAGRRALIVIGGLTIVIALAFGAYLGRSVTLRVRALTERAEAVNREKEARLRESEQRYRTLVEHAPEAVVVFNVETGRFVEANQNAIRMFGIPREELLRMGPSEVSPETQPDGFASKLRAPEAIARAVAGEVPVFEWTHRAADGREIPCEIRLVRLPSSDGTLIRGSMTDITDRRRAEDRQRLLVQELDHRVKNTLAAVLALAEQTLASSSTLEEYRDAFTGRVHAMARAHEALAREHWSGIELSTLVDLSVRPFDDPHAERIEATGERVRLDARVASAVALALHELATNAAKHGALMRPAGRVTIHWRSDDDGAVVIAWDEAGDHVPERPQREGLGLELVHGLISCEAGGDVRTRFAGDGFHCELVVPALSAAPGGTPTAMAGVGT